MYCALTDLSFSSRLGNVLFEAVEQSSDAIQITGPDSCIMVSLNDCNIERNSSEGLCCFIL